ncbi:MFS transporter [Roseibacterium sp. SDUM158017]|uniref:MFS transporter n=1 Tax=Roseicyclus salinarum TaxID=3036773 RepID=UPI00241526CA|nr:MFS transporter [Roseibacterium sp. SDUM158017]MDG4648192.1 MFS transporter [Roseibacterium sp. SDUM158017]
MQQRQTPGRFHDSTLSLMAAVFLLEIGSGLQGVLLPVRAEIVGFETEAIGLLGTMYYAGFVLGCLRLPGTVRRIGHVRCYASLSAAAASLALVHALTAAPVVWMGLRLLAGFCFAGLFMVAESWINDRATPQTRGSILGQYMLATWIGVIVGKLVYPLAAPDTFELFALASIAIALSMIPLTVTNGAVPTIPRPARLGLRDVYATAPLAVIGCLAAGLANSAFWTFAPLYARNEIGPGAPVALFVAVCVLGGALAQWPLGRFSDRIDRRWVIGGLSVSAAAAGSGLAVAPSLSMPQVYALGATFGASALTLYSICIAYANDRAQPEGYVDVSSHLLMVFGAGAIAGPFLCGLLISAVDYGGLFLFAAAIELGLACLVAVVGLKRSPAPAAERVAFAVQPPVSHGTQAVIPLQQGPEEEGAGGRA